MTRILSESLYRQSLCDQTSRSGEMGVRSCFALTAGRG
jgi:hypothetical protein